MRSYQIEQWTEDWTLICVHPSASAAAELLGIKSDSMSGIVGKRTLYRGSYWTKKCKVEKRFKCQCKIDGKWISLGMFETKAESIAHRVQYLKDNERRIMSP